ncbi:hypothetical protein [Curtobacterium sp. Curtsp57]
MKADEGPFRAIVIGRDSRFPIDTRVTAILQDHRDAVEKLAASQAFERA